MELCHLNIDTFATFGESTDVSDNPTAYPTTEDDISDFDERRCQAVRDSKYLIRRGDPDREMADVIAITEGGL